MCGVAGLRKNGSFLPVPDTWRQSLKLRDKYQVMVMIMMIIMMVMIMMMMIMILVVPPRPLDHPLRPLDRPLVSGLDPSLRCPGLSVR